MLKIFDSITALKKTAAKREAEKKEMADVVEQDKLIEMRGEPSAQNIADNANQAQGERHTLSNTSSHAQQAKAKSLMGLWNCIQTVYGLGLMGLLQRSVGWSSPNSRASSDTVSDVLFSNVKHMFFQPSEKELIVLLHFHLRAPIMLGKKKTSVRLTRLWRGQRLTAPHRMSNSTAR